MTGAPGTIRTCDPQYRKLMLYPAELRVHFLEKFVCSFKRQTSLYMMPLTGMEVNFNLNIERLFTSSHSRELWEIILLNNFSSDSASKHVCGTNRSMQGVVQAAGFCAYIPQMIFHFGIASSCYAILSHYGNHLHNCRYICEIRVQPLIHV